MGKSWKRILQPGKFYLQLCFLCLSSFSKNADNNFVSIEYRNMCKAFPISLLCWRDFKVKDNAIRIEGLHTSMNFFCLSGAEKELGMSLEWRQDIAFSYFKRKAMYKSLQLPYIMFYVIKTYEKSSNWFFLGIIRTSHKHIVYSFRFFL